MRSLLTAALGGLLLFGLPGCASEGLSGIWAGRGRGFAVLYADPRLSAARDDREAIERAEETPTYVPRIPHLAPRVTGRDPAHVAFDEAAARAAVHALDPSACVQRGALPGYGHARVTFSDEGEVSRVVARRAARNELATTLSHASKRDAFGRPGARVRWRSGDGWGELPLAALGATSAASAQPRHSAAAPRLRR